MSDPDPCVELEEERIELEEQHDALEDMIAQVETLQMYNWWNRYLNGCIPGMEGQAIEPKQKMSRAEFKKMLAEKPLFKKLIRFYMDEAAT